MVSLLAYILIQLIAPIFLSPKGDDTRSHFQYITSFRTLLSAGIYYPRWLPEYFGGFGAPVFYFYPPLVYYVTSFISWVIPSASNYTLFNILGLIAAVVSFIG